MEERAKIQTALDDLIDCLNSEAMQKNSVVTIHVDGRHIHCCVADISPIAEELDVEVLRKPFPDPYWDTEAYIIYRGWKLFCLEHTKEKDNAERDIKA